MGLIQRRQPLRIIGAYDSSYGKFFIPGWEASNLTDGFFSPLAESAPIAIAWPVRFDRAVYCATARIPVMVAASPGAAIRIGLAHDSAGTPGRLAYDHGITAVTTTGAKSCTVATTIKAGLYWQMLAINAECGVVGEAPALDLLTFQEPQGVGGFTIMPVIPPLQRFWNAIPGSAGGLLNSQHILTYGASWTADDPFPSDTSTMGWYASPTNQYTMIPPVWYEQAATP
jgi:hypothetical protein